MKKDWLEDVIIKADVREGGREENDWSLIDPAKLASAIRKEIKKVGKEFIKHLEECYQASVTEAGKKFFDGEGQGVKELLGRLGIK